MCSDVFALQGSIYVHGKEHCLNEKNVTYERMKMVYHVRLYEWMDSVLHTEVGKERVMEQCPILLAQVKYVEEMFEEVDNDVMGTGLEYNGRGNVRVDGYTVEETRSEMENSVLQSGSVRVANQRNQDRVAEERICGQTVINHNIV